MTEFSQAAQRFYNAMKRRQKKRKRVVKSAVQAGVVNLEIKHEPSDF